VNQSQGAVTAPSSKVSLQSVCGGLAGLPPVGGLVAPVAGAAGSSFDLGFESMEKAVT